MPLVVGRCAGGPQVMALPEIAWEVSLGIYAAWKGFRPSPIAEPADGGMAEPTGAPFAFSN